MANAQSICNKYHEFQAQINLLQPQIIAITESWCNDLISDAEIWLNGYNLYRKDRSTTCGGGVLLYIHQSLSSVPCISLNNLDIQEAIWCIISLSNNNKVLVGAVYRSPYSSIIN